MEAHIAKLDDLLFRERGIHITTLRHPHGFEWMMFDVPLQKERAINRRIAMGQPLTGYGWPGMKVRWCTGQLKTHLISKEVNRLKKEKHALHYVGIAADEEWRCKGEQYPLVDWKITEAQALQICYDRGYDWGGCTRSITAAPAGAVHSSALTNCASCAATTRSYGHVYGTWMTGHGQCLAPVPWARSRRIVAWRGWKSASPERRCRARETDSSPLGRAALDLSRLQKTLWDWR